MDMVNATESSRLSRVLVLPSQDAVNTTSVPGTAVTVVAAAVNTPHLHWLQSCPQPPG
jgi:hypothetical protein